MKIHKYSFLIFLAIVLRSKAQTDFDGKQFQISGTINGVCSGTMILQYLNANGNFQIDSTEIQGAVFTFQGHISQPTIASISLYSRDSNYRGDDNFLSFFLVNKPLTIDLMNGDFKNAIIEGSAIQKDFQELQNAKDTVTKKIFETSKSKWDDSEKQKVISGLVAEKNQKDYDYILSNPNSHLSAFCLINYHPDLTLDSLKYFYNHLTDKIKSSRDGKRIANLILKVKSTEIGQAAPDFSAETYEGHKIRLRDYNGKYVLLDFWASWCGPCRRSNKKLINLYQAYHPKGLEIISISLDEEKDSWKTAIMDDSTFLWSQVLGASDFMKTRNGEINSNDIIEKFAVFAIPFQILLDKDQKIIFKNEDDDNIDKLEKKLSEIFH